MTPAPDDPRGPRTTPAPDGTRGPRTTPADTARAALSLETKE
ncbi:hypothetical protein [Streptomyces sp. NPDC053367]